MNPHHYSACPICSQRGLSMIELMVAMTIGAVLIFGATQVFVNSQKSYGVSESVSRLQETARYAMSVIEPDIRMANYWGLLKTPGAVINSATQAVAPGAVAPGAAANVCGNNFVLDVTTSLQGDNNQYVLSATRQAGCNAVTDLNTGLVWNTVPVTTADTLTLRRASVFVNTLPFAPGVIMVCSTQFLANLFSNGGAGTACNPGSASAEAHNLIVDAYYVDRNSAQAANRPSLRRKTLAMAGGLPQVRDQEIIPGIEDLQIQFGVEPAPVAPATYTGVATQYINPPGVAGLPLGAQIVSVRIWLLVYADTPEAGFTDTRVYEYGDRLQATGVTGDLNSAAGAGMAYQPSSNPDASFNGPQHRRRLLISRTIQIRNALGT